MLEDDRYEALVKKLDMILESLSGFQREALRPGAVPLVIVESPFSNLNQLFHENNIAYARAAVRDSINRGEAPIAFHLLYPQDGILDDKDPVDRARGLTVSQCWYTVASKVVVYEDMGYSQGMVMGLQWAGYLGLPVEFRKIEGWKP